MKQLKWIIFCLVLFPGVYNATPSPGAAKNKNTLNLIYPALVDSFYAADITGPFWYLASAARQNMKNTFLQLLDSASCDGLDKNKYHYAEIKNTTTAIDATHLMQQDRLFTDAVIAYCKDLYQGCGINPWIKYDEWSGKYSRNDNDFIVGHLVTIKSDSELNAFINSLIPDTKQYVAYQSELQTQYQRNDILKAKQVATSMNFYRWIHHFGFEKSIVVNIASATLNYYENNVETLFSKMIVGKPSKKTPSFDATCKEVILYPYWNVPADIAIKELVPKYRKSPGLVGRERMQVLDGSGNIVKASAIDWSAYSSRSFPYRLRQSTGCDNSLGIIKFDLTSPFGVYLHDTNEKGLFASSNRYRSHGCMRVEKAVELGNYLLNNKLDTIFLKACIKDVKPTTIPLEKPVPVFVIYLTAYLSDSGVVNYYRDVYHLNTEQ